MQPSRSALHSFWVLVHRDSAFLFGAEVSFSSWIDECPSRKLICSRPPLAFRQSLAQARVIPFASFGNAEPIPGLNDLHPPCSLRHRNTSAQFSAYRLHQRAR